MLGPLQEQDHNSESLVDSGGYDVSDFYERKQGRKLRELWADLTGSGCIHIGLWQDGNESVAEAQEKMTEHIIRQANVDGLGHDAILVDLGSGLGVVGRLLRNPSDPEMTPYPGKIINIDITPGHLEKARENIPPGNNEFRLGDMNVILEEMIQTMGPESIDRFTALESIFHLPIGVREEVLKKIVILLKPGGRFVLTDAGLPKASRFMSNVIGNITGKFLLVHEYFSHEEWGLLAANYGLDFDYTDLSGGTRDMAALAVGGQAEWVSQILWGSLDLIKENFEYYSITMQKPYPNP